MVGRIFKNWPTKLLALGAAIILSSYVHGLQNPWVSTSATVDIQVIRPQPGYEWSLPQKEIAIPLRGPRNKVDAAVESIEAVVDLSRLHAGTHSVPVKVQTPQQYAPYVVQSTARTLLVTIESVFSRDLPVEVKLTSSPPVGWVVSEPSVTPGTATVSGRSSLVESVARLVAVANPTPARPSIDDYVLIKPLDSQGNEVKSVAVSPKGTHVAVRLVGAPATKSVYVSADVTGQPQLPYKVIRWTASPSAVIIKGSPTELDKTSTVATDPVDVSGAVADLQRYVKLKIPPGLQIQGPNSVKVTVKVALESTP